MTTPSPSLVLELQRLAQAGGADILELLRRTKTLAAKLKLSGVQEWIDHEMNGYPDNVGVPAYRNAPTSLMWRNKYNPPQQVMFPGDDELSRHFSAAEVRLPLSQISHLAITQHGVRMNLSAAEVGILHKCISDAHVMEFYRDMSQSVMVGILDAVQNKILTLALELEERGILGSGMTFSPDEARSAAQIGTVNHFYGPTIQGDNANQATNTSSPGAAAIAASDQAQIRARLGHAIEAAREQDAELAKALEHLTQAVTSTLNLTDEVKQIAEEQLALLAEQAALPAEKRKPARSLTSIAVALRGALGLVADGIQVWTAWGPIICHKLGISGIG